MRLTEESMVRYTRKNALNMSWLTRRVNSTTPKNLQQEEKWLSKAEHDEMPGRRWKQRRGGARKIRRTRKHRT